MDNETRTMLNAILEEIGKVEERTNKRFDEIDNRFNKLDARLEAMQHDINACKLEKDTVSILLLWRLKIDNAYCVPDEYLVSYNYGDN